MKIATLTAIAAIAVLVMILAFERHSDYVKIYELQAQQDRIEARLNRMQMQISNIMEDRTYTFTVPCSRNCKEGGFDK